MRKDIVSQAIVEEAHKNGFTVNVWNEDNPEEIRKYAAMGPDMMSSNYPDRLKQWYNPPRLPDPGKHQAGGPAH